MELLYHNGKLIGYVMPDSVPVIIRGTPIRFIQDRLRRWAVEEGRDYLLVDAETFWAKVISYGLGGTYEGHDI